MNNKIIFGHQIRVEVAKKGLRDMPPEIIQLIDRNLNFADRKLFREVCVMCPLLRYVYKDVIEVSGIVKVDLKVDVDACLKFINNFDFILNLNRNISLKLPSKNLISQVPNLGPKVTDIIDLCHGRITQIDIDWNVPTNLQEVVLQRLTNLRKMRMVTFQGTSSQIYKQIINNNCQVVQQLELRSITFSDLHFDVMLELKGNY